MSFNPHYNQEKDEKLVCFLNVTIVLILIAFSLLLIAFVTSCSTHKSAPIKSARSPQLNEMQNIVAKLSVGPIVVLSGPGIFPVSVSGDLLSWQPLTTVTNSALFPKSQFSSIEAEVAFWSNTLAWNAAKGATNYQLLVNGQPMGCGSNLTGRAFFMSASTNTFRVAANFPSGAESFSQVIQATALPNSRNCVMFKGPAKIEIK